MRIIKSKEKSILRKELKGDYKFFIKESNNNKKSKGYGLIRDKSNSSPEIASIASVGYGFAAFKGVVISDYSAIEETIEHGVSKDKKDAAYKAITAGVDIDMMSNVYSNNLKQLVEEELISEKVIDESVLRILKLKNKLGLFEDPYKNLDGEMEKRILLNEENLRKARELTAKTFVLLKNKNNILPLNKLEKIALIGPYVDNISILGSWSMFADKSKIITLKAAFESKIGKENVIYAKGSEILEEEEINQILQAEGKNKIYIENEKEKLENYIKEAIEVAKQVNTHSISDRRIL